MIPLIINSVNCIYAVIFGGIYTMGGLFGIGVSAFLIIYYIVFAFETMVSRQSSAYYLSSYKFMNFDQPDWWVKGHLNSYEFLVHWLVAIVMVALCNFPKYQLAMATILFGINFLCSLSIPTKEYKSEEHNVIRSIHMLKQVDSFLKTIWFLILTIFVLKRSSISSMTLKFFTIISIVILYAIVAINWGILLFRLMGWCGKGKEATPEGLQESASNYQPL